MNNIAPKLQKCWTHKIAFKIISKMLKQPHFFHNPPSTLSKDATCKILSFYGFWFNPIPHGGGGGGADSALLQIVFFITSVRDAAELRNLVTFPKI